VDSRVWFDVGRLRSQSTQITKPFSVFRGTRKGELPSAPYGYTLRTLRDVEVIDSELWLLLAIRQMAREEEGRPPSTARIDELLDERSAAAAENGIKSVQTNAPGAVVVDKNRGRQNRLAVSLRSVQRVRPAARPPDDLLTAIKRVLFNVSFSMNRNPFFMSASWTARRWR